MQRFATLLDRLLYMSSRNGKLTLLAQYFATTPDPDRGYALAALTGSLDLGSAKAGIVRGLITERVDPVLFGWSYDFVGDLAETVSLMWPSPPPHQKINAPSPSLGDVVDTLQAARKSEIPSHLSGWMDRMEAEARWALLKLITGGLRVGVSARLAKTALAAYGGQDVAEIEEIWHGLTPPYQSLFQWLDGDGEIPAVADGAGFRPLMLANPLEDRDLETVTIADYRAEWKWDGIRVQLAARNGEKRLYSRTGDDIGRAFPDVLDAVAFDAVVDGELLVSVPGASAPFADNQLGSFNDLQQRLNRKTVSKKMLSDAPAFVRVYDILFDGKEDLRALPFDERRHRLERWVSQNPCSRMDLSEQIPFSGLDELMELRETARATDREGLMLKHRDSPYLAGRPRGPWFKWKRDALVADCVLMYAQRGHGKRSSFYSDYTFGAWENGSLVPVGKAYSGFTDEELKSLDKWVRDRTTARYGPVREVEPGLVFEVAFDSVHFSKRHKSGVAMRFPRISRIRWDKPIDEADTVDSLRAMITADSNGVERAG
ncbi:MAG: cisplatin damage response ATP-dependent DNA ligase [Pseudomonadota bacterium]